MGSEGIPINPDVLRVARESRGYTMTELADLSGVHKTLISRLEAGIRSPSDEVLARIAEALHYPVSFFQQNHLVLGFEPTQLFHRMRRSVNSGTLSLIHARVNIIRWNLPKLLRSVQLPELRIHPLDVEAFEGSPSNVARAVRAAWGVPRGPVRNLTRLIEAAGALVIPFRFETDLIDAISAWPPDAAGGIPPLFFVDLDRPGDRLRFTLCHELSHIIMHRETLEPDMEGEADEFAAEFLMPRGDIFFEDFSLATIASMKQYWRVSMSSLIMRAHDLGFINARYKQVLYKKMAMAGYRKREPREVDVPAEQPSLYPGVVEIHQKELGYAPEEFAQLFDLYEEDVEALFPLHFSGDGMPRLRIVKM